MNNDKPELDLSFLDEALSGMDRDQMQLDLERIQRELQIATATVSDPNNFVIFWESRGVRWQDARAGVSKLGSILQLWLAKEGVIAPWKAEEHPFEDPPPIVKEFISATRTSLEIGLALGALLATRDGK